MCACVVICMLTSLLTACGSDQGSSSSQSTGGYKESKSMIIDVLKSDEGKKAIYEALTAGPTQSSSPSASSQSGESDSESEGGQQGGGNGGGGGSMGIKMLLPSQTSEEVRMAVKETITSPEYKKEFEKIMTDPQFAGDFAKAINAQSKQMHLQLIKDPMYQKSVGDIMKSPDVMKMFLELTKTPDYRKQSMTVIQEAMQSPLFKLQVMELLKTVVQQQLQPTIEKAPNAGKEGGKSGESGGDSGQSKDSGGEEGGQ